eukprot:Platyproteum_vivax@DN16091_c0_g1_i1.p1
MEAHRPQLHIAPMADVTYSDFRVFMRMLTKRSVLWTEMIVDQAAIHTVDRDRMLGFSSIEHPIICQLGGNNPETLAKAAAIVSSYGYDGINLNVGCPSSRVAQKGCFGASLMKTPELVAQCYASIKKTVPHLPVSIKMRLGVDEFDSLEFLHKFVFTIAAEGCTHFIVHARKAWLKGLSPKDNRSIPPLYYNRVYWLKKQFPDLEFTLNGGLTDISVAKQLALKPIAPTFSLEDIEEVGDGETGDGRQGDGRLGDGRHKNGILHILQESKQNGETAERRQETGETETGIQRQETESDNIASDNLFLEGVMIGRAAAANPR